jgi:hypothetical protein
MKKEFKQKNCEIRRDTEEKEVGEEGEHGVE